MSNNNDDNTAQIADRMMVAEMAGRFEQEFRLVGLQIPLIKGFIYEKEREILESISDLTSLDTPKSLMSAEASLSLAKVGGMIELLNYLLQLSEDINDDKSEE